MVITRRYYWRELTEDGLIKPFKAHSWDHSLLGVYGFDTEALEEFERTFGDKYLRAKYVLITCYGSAPSCA